jgi:spermidine synthase
MEAGSSWDRPMSIANPELRRAFVVPDRAVLMVFAATLFISAFLLFSVQPFFAKMVLPKLGGSPGVWSVAMVFFQSVLLAGYGYAHLLTSRLSLKAAVFTHLAVMAAAWFALPIAIPAGWGDPPESGQAIWVLGLFAVSVGLPFFAVSANGPLLQAWFARTGHAHARDPYFLYGASNTGSFASLFLYILLFEPLFTVPTQTHFWSAGYAALVAAIGLCGIAALRFADGDTGSHTAVSEGGADAPGWRDRVTWVSLAAVPSGLLVAVTAQVSTDLAAAPFLWVIPLALFLLTFVLVFRRVPLIPQAWMEAALPFAATAAVVSVAIGVEFPAWLSVSAHYGFFFVAAMAAHGALARLRPDSSHLTAFYFLMSVGGVIGGAFASLAAPYLFHSIAEYPILIVASLLVLRRVWGQGARTVVLGLSAALAVGWLVPKIAGAVLDTSALAGQIGLNAIALALASLVMAWRRPLLAVALFAIAVQFTTHMSSINPPLDVRRSFFGVTTVSNSEDGRHRRMLHGTTLHGAMRLDEAGDRPEPLTYYHSTSGMALAIADARARNTGSPMRVGIVGLGAGSLACYREAGEHWDFFEIDRDVVDLATNPTLFRFMPECAGDSRIIVGDARLKLAEEPAGGYNVLVIDAFSSDSIPVHLMTVEAMRLYLGKLAPGGLLVMHISNRHMELGSVLAANARELGVPILVGDFDAPTPVDGKENVKTASRVAFISTDPAALEGMQQSAFLKKDQLRDVSPWTDDFSNVLGAIWRNYME